MGAAEEAEEGPQVRRFAAWWLGLTSAREDGTALALLRVLVALSCLGLLGALCFTAEGRQTVVFGFTDVSSGGYRKLAGATTTLTFGLLGLGWIAAVLLLVGAFGRLPALVLAVTTHIVLTRNDDVSGSGDALLGAALLVLVLGDATCTLSVDARLRTGSFVDGSRIAAWPRRIGLFHLTVVYVATGLQKLVATAWTPLDGFSALYQILQSPHWTRFPTLVTDGDGLWVVPLAVGTAVTVAFELGFWLVLVSRRVRPLFATVGVLLHLGIWILLEVGAFSALSLAFYPLLFPQACARLGLALSTALNRAARGSDPGRPLAIRRAARRSDGSRDPESVPRAPAAKNPSCGWWQNARRPPHLR